MTKFSITYFYLQGASLKALDWQAGESQPVEGVFKTVDIMAETMEEALQKFGPFKPGRPKDPVLGVNYISQIEMFTVTE